MVAGGPGAAAAGDRVAATLEAARRVELGRLMVGVPGPATTAARRRALAAAEAAGRSSLVDEGRQAAIDFVGRAFAARGFSGTWAMTEMSMSVARPADRAAIAEALADAVTADAVDDLVDDDTADVLRETWSTIASAGPISEPGSLSTLTSALAGGSGRRHPAALAGAIFLLLLGLGGAAAGSPLAIGFLIVGVIALVNAVRGGEG